MATRESTRLGCALLLGAVLALPAGVLLGGLRSGGTTDKAAERSDATARHMFSPSVRSDPYFLARQRAGVEALERYCARTGESCAEARAARARIDQLGAD